MVRGYGKKINKADICQTRGFHDFQEFIDPQSGGFVRCKDCGKEIDCEDPDNELGA